MADLPADRDEQRIDAALTPEGQALTKILAAADPKYRPESAFYMRFAATMLTDTNFKDWLVGVVEAAKREALTEAADEATEYTLNIEQWGGSRVIRMPGYVNAEWLRARAGVGAVPELHLPTSNATDSADEFNSPVGAPLVGEGPTDA